MRDLWLALKENSFYDDLMQVFSLAPIFYQGDRKRTIRKYWLNKYPL